MGACAGPIDDRPHLHETRAGLARMMRCGGRPGAAAAAAAVAAVVVAFGRDDRWRPLVSALVCSEI